MRLTSARSGTATVAAFLLAGSATAQTGGYQLPPAPIPQILSALPPPALSVSPNRQQMALLGREDLPNIAEVSEPELRLAGVRINPRTSGPSRTTYYNGITLQPVGGGVKRVVQLPAGARISDPTWSPDGSHLAFANTTPRGIELWVVNAATGTPRRILGPQLNGTLGSPFDWMPDGRSLLVKRIPASRGPAPAAPTTPGGPLIQENQGRATPVRTYQDLLSTPHDERLFEHYFTSQLARVPLAGGTPAPIGQPGIIANYSVAPGGQYIRVDRIKRPYSYVAPLYSFGMETNVIDLNGRVVHQLVNRTQVQTPPIARDAVSPGPRAVSWRADAPATLVWTEALDEGDPKRPADKRDRVRMLSAPFSGAPSTLADLDWRYAGITWGRDTLALLNSRWSTTSRTRTYVVNPARPAAEPRLLVDRSAEDRYQDPGAPITTTNPAGYRVLQFAPDGQSIFLAGSGASPKGDYPFLDRMNLVTGNTERLWRNEDPYYETLVALLAPDGSRFITRRESLTEPPNYFVRDLTRGNAQALTDFPDPAPQLAGIQRQLITYPRADGTMLSAALYTPPGYDAKRDGPLPMLMWAYPREFRDADAASQVQDSPNRFSRPGGSSHLFLLTQGYAILDGPAMPIIGANGAEPNDTYLEQLVSSAQAAVDKVVEMGVADRNRIGIGGHSYGAFMTANLLAHSDLFRAGIARSGAYNRTLTPFGFQAEPRSYWEATETYNQMSPFNFANKVNEPILLIHGEADNNSGTFPIQSERFYAALKGHGATVRYVVLPNESHGYRARESVLHTLAEMVNWMDKHVKNAPPQATGRNAAGN